jgi:2-succinyl-5-enolpyruvyl-6-hydroxy-3-cyclohexene-1-carboxylate synthase
MSAAGGLHTAWARALALGLRSAGVGWAFVCPGSRSTPLALAAAEVFADSLSVVVDERSAAFAALGFARLSGAPAVMIVTSGSAGAHALPAIIEAEQSGIPLIVITADRPIELFEAGAPQTIDQHQYFGRHVRAAFEIGAPDPEALGELGRIAFRATRAALGPDPGAVHINARFRKPLEPSGATVEVPAAVVPELFVGERAPSERALSHVRALLSEAERPLFVVGPLPFSAAPRAEAQAALSAGLAALVVESGVAVAVELTSGVAVDLAAGALPLALLLEAASFEAAGPDLIVELGSPPVTTAYAAVAKRARRRVVVSPAKSPDPFGNATAFIEADAIAFARALSLPSVPRARAYRAALGLAAERARRIASRAASTETAELSEPAAMHAIAAALPENAILAIGNSLAVRDLDTYGNLSRPHVVLHQRGASGIDGLVAGAFGARQAAPPTTPVVLVIGDVSAQHDIGSFALLREVNAPLVIVVIDNGGGRIFDALPVKAAISSAVFDKLFTTRAEPFLKGAVSAFGVAHVAAESAQAVGALLEVACRTPKATVIEVTTPHEASARARAALRSALRGGEP